MLRELRDCRLVYSAHVVVFLVLVMLTGCKDKRDPSFIGTFRMGEKVQAGDLIYSVLEANWRTEIAGRAPENRFLFVNVSITNASKFSFSLPSFTLQAAGKSYAEVTDNMDNVQNWLGLLRNLGPNQSERGWVVFDVPMGAYRLVVSDGGELGSERVAHVDIPVQLE